MLRILFPLNPKKLQTKQATSLFSYCFSSLFSPLPLPSSSATQTNKTHLDPSSLDFNSIAEVLVSKRSHLCEAKSSSLCSGVSIKDLLLDVSQVVPDLTRWLRRVLVLRPEDVLELLEGFEYECERVAVKRGKVESLWGIFKWASDQDRSFRHLPRSCEVMASMLLQYGMLREVQLLLLAAEKQGIVWNSRHVFSGLIEGYVRANDVERAVLVYDQMRERGLAPLLSCYRGLVDLLVKMERTKLVYGVCMDMVEFGINLGDSEKVSADSAVELLCEDGMIQEAWNLMKKVMALGAEPSNLVLNKIACGFCEKKDFEDLLRFLVESKCSLNVLSGNKIIGSLCSNAGVKRADLFRLELEHIGFRPDEITFGIFISWCCKEGNLRSAFIYLSEMLSRGLKPDIWSYNALIGGVLKEGLWKHAQAILDEMVENGIVPILSTFKVLLAGYCKARQFDKVKLVVYELVKRGLVESSSLEDPLSKAFTVLGLNPLSVKLKRDNAVGLYKTEFFDSLGNGLYLDTDLDEFEKVVTGILEDSFIPDFDLLIKKECNHGNLKAAFSLTDEMVRWGQEVSPSVFLTLVKRGCASYLHIKQCSGLLKKMPKLSGKLDEEVLNLLIKLYCKKGLVYKARILFDQMLQKNLTIMNDTHTALILGFCKNGNVQDLHEFGDVAGHGKWLPKLKDFKSLVECLCHHRMLKEAVKLFKSMLVSDPYSWREICHLFIEKLSSTGFTSVAHILEKELLQQGFFLDDATYSHLIRGFCKEQKYTVAFTLLDTMLSMNMVPCLDVSLTLIPQLCSAGKHEKAIALIEVDLGEQSKSLVHSALIKGFCMTGREETAALFYDMLLKGVFLDDEAYNVLFGWYCKHKNLRKVRQLLGAMIRKHISLCISSYRNCLQLMCMEGRFNCALRLKDIMLGECKSHNLIVYNILIFNLFSSGNSLVVNKLLDELQERGFSFNGVTYNFLIHGFSRCGDPSSCLFHLSTMISLGFRPSHRSLRTIIAILHHLREFDKVMELSQEMELRGWVHGSTVQNAIVDGLLSLFKLQEAEHFLDRTANKGLIPDTINYDYLIKRFCLHGRLNKAVDLLNIMLKKGNLPDFTSYDSIVQSFCAWNHLNQAMDFHAEMLDRDMRPSINTWDMLVQKLCQHGRTAEAEQLLMSMYRVGETPTRLMYSSLINQYHFENNLRKASELIQMMQQGGYEPDFNTHWSLISKLSNLKGKRNDSSSKGFLSRLLSGNGIPRKDDSNAKIG